MPLKFRNPGQEGIDPALQAALESLGIPIEVTSGYRSPAYNAKVGGAKRSAHTEGKATDISLAGKSETERAEIVRKLAQKGVKRFITYTKSPDMLHVDLAKPVAGDYWFMHDKSNKNMGRAPGWFRSVSGELLGGRSPHAEVAQAASGAKPALASSSVPLMAMFGEQKAMAEKKDDKKKPALSKKAQRETKAPWIDIPGVKIGPYQGPGSNLNLSGLDPFGGDYTPGPQHSTGGNLMLTLPQQYLEAIRNWTIPGIGSKAIQSASDFWFKPEGELLQTPLTSLPQVDLKKAFGQGPGGVPGGGPQRQRIETGIPAPTLPDPFQLEPMRYPDAPELPPPPDAPMLQAPDYSGYREAMAQYAPKQFDEPEFKRDNFMALLAQAFAAGAGGSGWSGAGGALARAGAQMGLGAGDLQAAIEERLNASDEANREWGMQQADLERQLMESSTSIGNQNAQIGYENQTRRWDTERSNTANQYEVTTKNLQELHATAQQNAKAIYETEVARRALGQPEIANTTADGMVIKDYDKDGNLVFDVVRWDQGSKATEKVLDTMKKKTDVLGNTNPQVQLEKYNLLMADGNTEAVKYQMVVDALEGGYAEQLIEDMDDLNATVDDTMAAQGIMPTGSDYNEKRTQMLATLAAQRLDLTNSEQMMLAAQMGNMGAQLLLQRGAQ